MKKIYAIMACLGLLAFPGCQEDEDLSLNNVGYLRLEVGTDNTTLTKAEEAEYNPKQIAVKIIDEAGLTVKETDDYTTWTEAIPLSPGKYKISASSAGFDGSTAAVDKPYYAGLDSVTVEAGKPVSKTVTCTLANVLVTVEFNEAFKAAFKSATVVVRDTVVASNQVSFKMNDATETQKAYFPVTGLFADLAVTNQKDVSHEKQDTVRDVKARENVILRYQLGEPGNGSTDIDIELDGTTRTYIYTIGVPLTETTTLVASEANAWSKFAYLNGEIASFAGIFNQSNLSFQYKTADAEEWTSVSADLTEEEKDKKYSVKLSGLNPATKYQYRLYYKNGEEEFTSDPREFTTEEATELVNGSFDDWYEKTGKYVFKNTSVWYACSEEYYTTNEGSFWDSSNPGTGEGAAVLISDPLNPTTGVSSPVNTAGGKAAQLKSATTAGYIAAASLYTGSFGGVVGIPTAEVNFGQPFTSRPIALKGYYKYIPQVINYVDRQPDGANIVKNETIDECSIYIALAKKTYTINNGDSKTFIDFENDENIIAYGELPSGAATSGEGYTDFEIKLKYKNLTDVPTHIIVVCSASKYGDYMTGGEGSTLYVDDFSLVYDGEPEIWVKE